MKYIGVVLITVMLLSGCSTIGKTAKEQVKAQLFSDVQSVDCWIGFTVGTSVGETETLADKALREALQASVTPPNEDYGRCYKWGLVYKAHGEKAIEAIKKGIKMGMTLVGVP